VDDTLNKYDMIQLNAIYLDHIFGYPN